MADQQQAIRPARHQCADLIFLDLRLIGRTGHEQHIAPRVQLFLKRLKPSCEDRVLHRWDNRADGEGAFRGHHARAEIWCVSKSFDGDITRFRVCSTARSGEFRQRETVAVDTPAARATSSKVGTVRRSDIDLLSHSGASEVHRKIIIKKQKAKCKRLQDSNVSAYTNLRINLTSGVQNVPCCIRHRLCRVFRQCRMGAFAGMSFLSDVGEMLVLFAASILFVVAILQKEADRKNKNGS